jgi:X-Pro dipeptidyl-peptidase
VTPSVPVRDGVTQPVLSYPDAVRERVFVVTGRDRDANGAVDLVALDVIRPAQADGALRVPVVLEASPYFADLGRGPESQVKSRAPDGTPRRFPLGYDNYFVPRGYAVALLDLPGTGGSQGCLDYGGPGDVDAVVAAVDWLTGRGAAQDGDGAVAIATWSTGAVGLIGKSYDGFLANAVAARGVPGLRTAVAIAAPTSVYDYLTAGGVRVGKDFLVGFVAERSTRAPSGCAASGRALEAGQDDATALPSPFWAARDVRPHAGDVRAAMLVVHGLGDRNVPVDQATRWWAALGAAGVPRRMWLLQGGHVDPFDVRRAEWLDTLHRWFDHWLAGVENGVDSHPLVTVEQPDGSWRESTAWPDPAATGVPLPLPGAVVGRLVGAAPVDPDVLLARVLPTRTERLGAAPSPAGRPAPDVVVLPAAPLPRDLRLSGTVRVQVRLRASSPDPALFAALVELGPASRPDLSVGVDGTAVDRVGAPFCIGMPAPDDDGCFRRLRPVTVRSGAGRVTAGWQRVGLDAGGRLTPLRPGATADVAWDLPPVERVVPAGRRLAVVLAAARPVPDGAPARRPAPAVVDVRSLAVTLPVVGGAAASAGTSIPAPR